ncbi:hypothetical protein RUM43_013436 [Polyplax serrata]|uniref:Uncharacterized protein n=1 Tax=Polyplax serrata TaxID=468196 RepID=A0AAN8P200_POLSC
MKKVNNIKVNLPKKEDRPTEKITKELKICDQPLKFIQGNIQQNGQAQTLQVEPSGVTLWFNQINSKVLVLGMEMTKHRQKDPGARGSGATLNPPTDSIQLPIVLNGHEMNWACATFGPVP